MLSRFEKFAYDINEISLHWHRIASAEMKSYGLKGGSALYFLKLYGNPDGVTAAELGTMCGRDKADVSREIRALEKAGLVSRLSDGKGIYRAPIVLTDRGRELAEIISRKVSIAVEQVGKSLTDDERTVFYMVLDKITSNIQQLSESGLIDNKGEQQ